ncbi:hypothetical protein AN641_02115 [Candidatus Epulonipiscioides gigas]|nr:hypothetical protein AN641_02115 [Epulopiscium sp. SCG-C07WGA-EpuloA2]
MKKFWGILAISIAVANISPLMAFDFNFNGLDDFEFDINDKDEDIFDFDFNGLDDFNFELDGDDIFNFDFNGLDDFNFELDEDDIFNFDFNGLDDFNFELDGDNVFNFDFNGLDEFDFELDEDNIFDFELNGDDIFNFDFFNGLDEFDFELIENDDLKVQNNINVSATPSGEMFFKDIAKIELNIFNIPVKVEEANVNTVSVLDSSKLKNVPSDAKNTISINNDILTINQYTSNEQKPEYVEGNILIQIPTGKILDYKFSSFGRNINLNASND